MFKLVLTGGPCSGKSTSLNRIEAELASRGYHVMVIAETASEIINSKIGPNKYCGMDDFQKFIFDTQIHKEKMVDEASKYYDPNKLVVIFDRGLMDGAAYTTNKNFEALCQNHGFKRGDIFDRYDAVFHLVTAAKGTNSYTVDNNSARRETPAEAIVKDDATLKCWVGHPHLKVFDNKVNFTEKINNVINELLILLGKDPNKEIEKKYLIKYPSFDTIASMEFSRKAKMVQMYLKTESPHIEVRLRHIFADGAHTYCITEKRKSANPVERYEKERRITDEEYAKLLLDVDHSMYPVSKTRYTFVDNGRCYELDIYDDEHNYAILEVEMDSIDEKIELPNGIELIKDVTNEEAFKNYNIAKNGTSLSEICRILCLD